MTDTPAPVWPTAPANGRANGHANGHGVDAQAVPEDLLGELLWLARDAQERLPHETLGDRGYVLGQRNTYARAAGLVAARDHIANPSDPDNLVGAVDPVLAADRIVHALAEGRTDLAALRADVLNGIRATPAPDTAGALDWVGRKAFDARYGDLPGIDHDYGMRWGAHHNQRISLRRSSDATSGMLYAFDPTWDEYALLQHDVPTQVVDQVFHDALRRDEYLPVEDFAAMVQVELRRHSRDLEPVVLAFEP